MESTDLDKMVDKLLQFHGRIPNTSSMSHTWWQKECLDQLKIDIDNLIKTIDAVGEAFK